MNKRILVVSMLAMMLFLNGCFFIHVKRPLDLNLDKTVLGNKIGKSSYQSILWLVAWGDAGAAAAAKNGGITELNHMDIEYFTIFFGTYYKATTIVYGK